MWLSFAVACFVGAVIVLVPGLLVASALALPVYAAISFASVLSVGFYGLSAIVFGLAGISVNGWLLFGVGVVIGAIVFGVSRALKGCGDKSETQGSSEESDSSSSSCIAPWLPLIACGVALLTVIPVFVMSIGSPENFIQYYDNAYHLSRAQGFETSGNYGSFYISFYPSAWHCLVAMVASAAQVKVTVAVNAMTLVVYAVCYPLSLYALLAAVFGERSRVTFLGCLLCTVIAYFPWRIMCFGPLYPNVLAFALMPAVCAAFISCIDNLMRQNSRHLVAPALFLFIVGGVTLALAQPNAIFSAAIFLAPYCLYKAWAGMRAHGKSIVASAALPVVLALAVAVAWYVLYKSPVMSGVVDYPRDTRFGIAKSLVYALALGFTDSFPQTFTGCVVLLGALGLLFTKGKRWLPFSYGIAVIFFVVCISISSELRNLLVGFWYSDYYRLGATATIFALPLLAYGFDMVLRAVEWCLARLHANKMLAPACVVATAFFFVLSYVPLGFLPNILKARGYSQIITELKTAFTSEENHSLTSDELAFLEQVKEITGDSKVVNQPFDGSVFAASAAGVNVIYDQFNYSQYGPNSTLLTTDLKDIATNQQVQAAVDALGVEYVLQLDEWDQAAGDIENQAGSWYDLGFDEEDWTGVNELGEDSVGFTLLLKQGDMRLYRIDSAVNAVQ